MQEGFVPLVRQIQGFRGYYLLDGGPDVLITIYQRIRQRGGSACLQREGRGLGEEQRFAIHQGMPEVMVGNVMIAEVA
jgi:hypothetical protein